MGFWWFQSWTYVIRSSQNRSKHFLRAEHIESFCVCIACQHISVFILYWSHRESLTCYFGLVLRCYGQPNSRTRFGADSKLSHCMRASTPVKASWPHVENVWKWGTSWYIPWYFMIFKKMNLIIFAMWYIHVHIYIYINIYIYTYICTYVYILSYPWKKKTCMIIRALQ